MKHSSVLVLGGFVLLASCMSPPPTAGPSVNAPTASALATGEGTALAALAQLPVRGRAPKTGYTRDRFGERWTDDNDDLWGRNGCDTRDDILRRDLADVVLREGGCMVSTGMLHDPYTGLETSFVRGPGTSSVVQIDHVVPLSNAWQTGAQQWTVDQRRDFANDPLELIATRGSVNQAKGDGDAATWLPPNKPYRCAYAARIVAIKVKWHLWVTAAERDALARQLQPCGALELPTEPGTA